MKTGLPSLPGRSRSSPAAITSSTSRQSTASPGRYTLYKVPAADWRRRRQLHAAAQRDGRSRAKSSPSTIRALMFRSPPPIDWARRAADQIRSLGVMARSTARSMITWRQAAPTLCDSPSRDAAAHGQGGASLCDELGICAAAWMRSCSCWTGRRTADRRGYSFCPRKRASSRARSRAAPVFENPVAGASGDPRRPEYPGPDKTSGSMTGMGRQRRDLTPKEFQLASLLFNNLARPLSLRVPAAPGLGPKAGPGDPHPRRPRLRLRSKLHLRPANGFRLTTVCRVRLPVEVCEPETPNDLGATSGAAE